MKTTLSMVGQYCLGLKLRQGTVLTVLATVVSGVNGYVVAAQTRSPSRKLPSAEKIVERYLDAVGGKERVAMIQDASYEWIIQLGDQTMGMARTQVKAPASLRSELIFGNGRIISSTNSRSAWVMGLDGQLHTLTGVEALLAKLEGLLRASYLVSYKKSKVLARALSLEEFSPDPAYSVEFSTRNGARLRYSFSARTNLLLKIDDETRKTVTRFDDYRVEQGLQEPHRVFQSIGGSGELTFVLQRVSYNTGIADLVFDPPRTSETLNLSDQKPQ